MYPQPDYTRLRDPNRFSVSLAGCYQGYLDLTGIPIREYFLDANSCAEMYRQGRVLARKMFGPDLNIAGLSTPYIAYGHISGLGARLTFPEGGEAAVAPLYDSLQEGIKALRKPVDFASSGMAPFYVEFHRTLQAAFPGERVGFAYSNNGPITTACLLRGQDFLMDLYDHPDQVGEFLRLLVDSMLKFHAWKTAYLGNRRAVSPSGGSLADDLASLVPPDMWKSVVLPAWNRWFEGVTTGRRSAHCENLSPRHLRHLETIGLSSYDPCISAQLNPRIIRDACRVPFAWTLVNFHLFNMDQQDVEDCVFQAAAYNAEGVGTALESGMCNPETVAKVRALVRAGQEVQRLVKAGVARADIGARASAVGRKKFWPD